MKCAGCKRKVSLRDIQKQLENIDENGGECPKCGQSPIFLTDYFRIQQGLVSFAVDANNVQPSVALVFVDSRPIPIEIREVKPPSEKAQSIASKLAKENGLIIGSPELMCVHVSLDNYPSNKEWLRLHNSIFEMLFDVHTTGTGVSSIRHTLDDFTRAIQQANDILNLI